VSADGNRRSSRLANLLVVTAWIAVAVIANVIVALAPTTASDTGSALLPQDANTAVADSRIAQAFPGTGTNAIAYLLLEGRDQLGPADQRYYDAAVSALRADTQHVGSVLDWWSDPLTAPLGLSPDGRSGIAMVWLKGQAGSAQARESLDAARAVVQKVPPSAGLRARIAAPSATHGMPVHMTAWQGAAIVIAAALIAVLLLVRARQSGVRAVGIVLLTAGLSLAVAWPLAALVWGHLQGNVSTVFAGTLAAVLTIGAFGILTIYAFVSRRDFSAWGSFLIVGLWVLIGTMLLNFFFQNTAVDLWLASVAVLLFSGLLVFDTWRLRNFYGPDEYVGAAVQIYLDLLNIFMAILRVLGNRRN